MAYSSIATAAATTLSVSDEAYGNNIASRAVAAELDDNWAASYPGASAVIPDLFSAASGFTGNKTFIDSIGSNYDVAWSFGFSIANTGTGPADADSILLVDSLPSEITFYNGDIDDTGPETGSILFSQSSGAGLTFTELTDVKYSDLAAKPSALSDCDYTPVGTYYVNVRHICVNPKGSLTSGTPDPAVSIKFRARIK